MGGYISRLLKFSLLWIPVVVFCIFLLSTKTNYEKRLSSNTNSIKCLVEQKSFKSYVDANEYQSSQGLFTSSDQGLDFSRYDCLTNFYNLDYFELENNVTNNIFFILILPIPVIFLLIALRLWMNWLNINMIPKVGGIFHSLKRSVLEHRKILFSFLIPLFIYISVGFAENIRFFSQKLEVWTYSSIPFCSLESNEIEEQFKDIKENKYLTPAILFYRSQKCSHPPYASEIISNLHRASALYGLYVLFYSIFFALAYKVLIADNKDELKKWVG